MEDMTAYAMRGSEGALLKRKPGSQNQHDLRPCNVATSGTMDGPIASPGFVRSWLRTDLI